MKSLKQQQSNLGTGNKRIPLLSIDHTKDGTVWAKVNGRAIHSVGNRTINLSVFLSATCSLPFSFTDFMKEKNPPPNSLLFLFPHFDIFFHTADSVAHFTPLYPNFPFLLILLFLLLLAD